MRNPWYVGRVGQLITGVGLVHTACTPMFFPEAVRTAGFWFAITGIATAAFGWMTGHVERRGDRLPTALPVVLATVGVVGLTLDPKSGFWVFLPLAEVARRAIRRSGDSE